uniref:Methyltransferase FkbM family n=1 Tax=Rhodopseudomonas palustris (strain BisA53) TaxID=316055 RepID=Q07SL9_RHOP5
MEPRSDYCTLVSNNGHVCMKMLSSLFSALPRHRKASIVDVANTHLAEVSYHRLSCSGFSPGGIIDVGAYRGDWSLMARSIFQAPILMIEAQKEKSLSLQQAARKAGNASYEIGLLSENAGETVTFHVMETGSSMYPENSNASRISELLKTTTLDDVVRKHQELKRPFLLKLDVQGAELDILSGATESLDRVEVIQLEVALMPYNSGAPDFADVVAFMKVRGFLFFDVCGYVKPNPPFLSQMDALFVQRNSALRKESFVF